MLFLFFFSRVNLHAFNFAFTQHTPSLAAPPPPTHPYVTTPSVCAMHCGRALWQRRQQQNEDECSQDESSSVATSRQQYIKVQQKHIDEWAPGSCCQAEAYGGCYVVVFLLHRWNGIEARTSSEAGDNLVFFSIIIPPPWFPPPTIHSLHQSALAGDSRQSYLSDFVLHQGCGDWK